MAVSESGASETAPGDGRIRTFRWMDPHAAAQAVRNLSGLEAMRAIMRGDVPSPPIAELMDFTIASVEEGRVVFECTPAEYHYNPIGRVHGGVAATLLDSAMGCAIHTAMPAGAVYTTTDLQVRYVRGINVATGTIVCEGKTVHIGRQIAIAEGRITDRSGKLLATGTTACAVLRG